MKDIADILGSDAQELALLLTNLGQPAFRAKQLFQWLQQKAVLDYQQMANLPADLRRQLAENYPIRPPQVLKRQESAAGDTVKLLLQFADGEQVEMVVMFYQRQASRDRVTCCVSSQSGCRMGCLFCVSGQFNQPRNLTAGEIVAQVLLGSQIARERGLDDVTNVVYMGMGEPLLNLAAVQKSILLLNDAAGQQIGQRRIVVSTCGLVPQIYQLADWGQQIGLAVSLHSADPQLRRQLLPVAGQYSLSQLMAACEYFREHTGRRVTFEYALFAGVNDSPAAAAQLAQLLTGSDILVNIIPANPGVSAGFLPSGREIIEAFGQVLEHNHCNWALREARGLDIDAACGQLRQGC